jgi:hypothetical protein
VTYTLTLGNTESKLNKVDSLLITFPSTLAITGWDDELTRVGSRFSWNGTLLSRGQKQFEISFRPERSGVHNITLQLSNTFYSTLQAKNILSTRSLTSKVEVKLKPLAPRVSFILNKKQINSSEPSNVHVFVSNPNTETTFYDIDTIMVSNLLGNRSLRLEKLAPGQETEVFFIQFIAPSVAKDTTLSVAFNGTYRTQYYESFKFNTANSLLIKKDPNFNASAAAASQIIIQNQTTATQQIAATANSTPAGNGQAQPSAPAQQPAGNSTQPPKKNFIVEIIAWFKQFFGNR